MTAYAPRPLFSRQMRVRRRVTFMRRALGFTFGGWVLCFLEVVVWQGRALPALVSPPQMVSPSVGTGLWPFVLIILTGALLVQVAILGIFEIEQFRIHRQAETHQN